MSNWSPSGRGPSYGLSCLGHEKVAGNQAHILFSRIRASKRANKAHALRSLEYLVLFSFLQTPLGRYLWEARTAELV